MKRVKTSIGKGAIIVLILLLLPTPINAEGLNYLIGSEDDDASALSSTTETSEPEINAFQQGSHARAEWAIDILDSDVLWETGFEEGDDLPELNYNINSNDPPNRLTGGQSFVTDEYFNGNISYQERSSAILPGRRYIENGTDLSVSFRAKSNGEGRVNFWGAGSRADFGTPLPITFVEKVNFGDRSAKVSDLSYFIERMDNNTRTYLANQKGAYTTHVEVTSVDHENNVINLNRPFAGEFEPGDPLLRHNHRSPVQFSNRTVEENEWNLFNINTRVANYADYNTLNRGFGMWIRTTTHDTVWIDEVKLGYATRVKLYRDNVEVYDGYLSEYNDTNAVDKARPDKVTGLNVNYDSNNTVLTWNKPEDNGTTYNYHVEAINHQGQVGSLSGVESVEVVSDIKGYSVVVDDNPDTIPNNVIDEPEESLDLGTLEEQRTYVHIRSVDGEGNVSDPVHYLIEDVEAPVIELTPSTTEWTNGSVMINIEAEDNQSGVKKVKIVGENIVKDSDFSEEWEHWRFANNGVESRIENGNVILDDDSLSNNRIAQSDVFKDTVVGATHYAEVVARGDRTLNVRYGTGRLEDSQTNYAQELISSSEFDTYRFELERYSTSTDSLVVERNGDFSEGFLHWDNKTTDNTSGKIEVEEGKVILGDNSTSNNRFFQLSVFKDSVVDANYKSKVTARGTGLLNSRFGAASQVSPPREAQELEDQINYENYVFNVDRFEGSNDNLIVEKIGNGHIEIVDVNVYSEKIIENGEFEVKKNGTYTIVAEDNAGNISSKTIEVSNIDNEAPIIELTQNQTGWTNGNVEVNVDVEYGVSGINSVIMTGENMIKNNDFSEGNLHWITELGGTTAQIENGTAVLTDDSRELNRIRQDNVFSGSLVGASYYAEIVARGQGKLNTRFGYNVDIEGSGPQRNHVHDIDSDEFQTYRFMLEREPWSTDPLMIEKIDDGHIEVAEIAVFSELELDDNQFEVTDNGTYRIVAEDKAGNISIETINIDKIDRVAPEIELSHNPTGPAYEDVTVTAQVSDDNSGVSSLIIKGENVVRNTNFEQQDNYWGETNDSSGTITFENNRVIFEDSNSKPTKLQQFDILPKGVQEQIVVSIFAKGTGELNARYGFDTSTGSPDMQKNSVYLDNVDEFEEYQFVISDSEFLKDNLVIEMLSPGKIEIDSIKAYETSAVDLDNGVGELSIKDNGVYEFIVVDNAGNITVETYGINNLVRTRAFNIPTIEPFRNVEIQSAMTELTTNISNLEIHDWTLNDDTWRVDVEATKMKTLDGKDELSIGSLTLAPLENIDSNNGTLTKGYNERQVIDGGPITVLEGTNTFGEVTAQFEDNSLGLMIDPSTVKKGDYNATITWTLTTGP